MPTRPILNASPTAVAAEYSGQWVAWSSDHTRIVAHASTIDELWQIVRQRKIEDPVFEKIPRYDTRFVGRR